VTHDLKYYEYIKTHSIASRLLIRARQQIYADFIKCCRPESSDTIIDVGVSDVLVYGSNFFESKYPYPKQITAVGIHDGLIFSDAFPCIDYVQLDPHKTRLPFDNKSFDIAVSNAVLEHVGSDINQAIFVTELRRVARAVFITVPNRFFPVEHHTGIPIFHFWDGTFSTACKLLHKDEWSSRTNLILMSKKRLRELMPGARIGFTGIRMGPFSSNLFAYRSDRHAAD
jgi:hypothetical protein